VLCQSVQTKIGHLLHLWGFALVKQNQVTLVNSAESKDKVDAAKAEQAFLEAQEQLDKAVGPKEKVEANFAFKRARTRYQLVN
jgi:F0F1-type ATP synthase epsilon subunit